MNTIARIPRNRYFVMLNQDHKPNLTVEIVAISTQTPEYRVSKADINQLLSPQLIYGVVAVLVILALTQYTTKLIESVTKLIESITKLIDSLIN